MPSPPRPVLLPFPAPLRETGPKVIFEVELDPAEYRRQIVIECHGPEELLSTLRIHTWRVIG